jgi:hypothetical protein
MAEAVRGYKPKEFIIQSLDGEKSIDITNSILSIDYFEDILKPDISMIIQVTNTYSIVSGLPVRGGERVYVDLETASGDFTMNTQQDVLYVYKVSGIDGARMAENFTLHLTTREYLSNETSRCSRRYSGKISESVKDILSNVLSTSKYIDANIEETSNAYSFIGSMKKPFNVLTWLGPKALSSSAGSSDSNPNGSKTEQATGTAGFFFFENKEGYNFKSIDGMVSQLKQSEDIQIFIWWQGNQSE